MSRCNECNGLGSYTGIGYVKKDCFVCDGKGYVTAVKLDYDDDDKLAKPEVKVVIKKRRNRRHDDAIAG